MSARTQPIFLLMPQWQGSSASRAMLLMDGAAHLRGDLPQSASLEVPVPAHAGDALGTPIARLSSLLATRNAARELLRERHEPPITLGGDCASSLAGIERAIERDPGTVVLWFDAHPDLQHPSTSPSGAASGMTLRHALGDGVPDLISTSPVAPEQVLIIGAREVDAEEHVTIEELGIHRHEVREANEQSDRISEWIERTRATSVYVHIDLDVLDPAGFSSVHAPVPFGMDIGTLTQAIRAAVALVPLAGAAICEFAPADSAMADEDAPTVLRILAALTSGGAR
ncbi:arginase family protein [Leucobacter denitrificans]|uniref:Arginase family protein n=1 Tax=Leucobacter denitrificans TaxID=683042 RepID=A0A7G9S6G2_9MICO|nr:arginase family protein [Leucobacter denitrificans]QNN63437.1 arginase family protein [Leucobacter denitrificans]